MLNSRKKYTYQTRRIEYINHFNCCNASAWGESVVFLWNDILVLYDLSLHFHLSWNYKPILWACRSPKYCWWTYWDCLVNAGRQLLQWQCSKRKACLYKVYKDWHRWDTQSCLVWTSNWPYASGEWMHNAHWNTKFQVSSNHFIGKDRFLACLSNGHFSDVVSAIFWFDYIQYMISNNWCGLSHPCLLLPVWWCGIDTSTFAVHWTSDCQWCSLPVKARSESFSCGNHRR